MSIILSKEHYLLGAAWFVMVLMLSACGGSSSDGETTQAGDGSGADCVLGESRVGDCKL